MVSTSGKYEQLVFVWPRRVVKSAMHLSWRDTEGVVHRVTMGEHSTDYTWPWWTPQNFDGLERPPHV
jgi:hypothetical protein